ncbi:MAG: HAMP domain-containing histidine kinase [Clostridia bacterium]|nr:HAMP domain-containing histidine kinase [Clostridia bacterium]
MSVEIGRSEQVKNDFISSVSHELRTPLTAINGWAETLNDNMESPAILKRGLTVITKEAANLKAMLDELLDFSRMQSGRLVVHFGQVNVGDEVEDVIFSFSETLRQDDFAVNFENKLGDTWISADRARLRQVFVVLIDNARKHSHEGKYLDITLEESFFREGDPCVMLTFRDHGAGIPEDELPHVTEKFYKGSSKRPGSGIGLAVAKEIITLHDGSLLIRNAEEGTGTVITIKLPYQHETTPSETEDTTHA